PEVVLKAVAEREVLEACAPVIVGDARLLAHTARTLNLLCGYPVVRRGEPLPEDSDSPLIYHLDNVGVSVEPGVESAAAGRAAVEACRAEGLEVSGPHSADTVFLRASRGEFDAVVSCYHDQAMIPVKCLSFGEAVNVTLGLPFIRTSVDHGTAFDIAGRGVAEHSSMVAAIKLAAHLARADESGRAVEV